VRDFKYMVCVAHLIRDVHVRDLCR
jgi:hypothetical protein